VIEMIADHQDVVTLRRIQQIPSGVIGRIERQVAHDARFLRRPGEPGAEAAIGEGRDEQQSVG
jgi:hypothetical protein